MYASNKQTKVQNFSPELSRREEIQRCSLASSNKLNRIRLVVWEPGFSFYSLLWWHSCILRAVSFSRTQCPLSEGGSQSDIWRESVAHAIEGILFCRWVPTISRTLQPDGVPDDSSEEVLCFRLGGGCCPRGRSGTSIISAAQIFAAALRELLDFSSLNCKLRQPLIKRESSENATGH